jgi:hypothetical protein
LAGPRQRGRFHPESGVSKLPADEQNAAGLHHDEQTAAGLHQMAAGAYPFLATMKPQEFAPLLGAGEIAAGSALLPVVPTGLAGLALTGFSGGLLASGPARRAVPGTGPGTALWV